MQQDVDRTGDDSESLRVVLLDPLVLALDVREVRHGVRVLDDERLAALFGSLVPEEVVRDADDHALSQERVARERLLADELFSDFLELLALPRVLDREDHRGVLAV